MAKGSIYGAALLLAGCGSAVGSQGQRELPGGDALDDPSAAVESSGPPREPAATAPSWRVGDTSRATKPLAQFACRKDAFCDDFEGATPGSKWSSSVPSDGSLTFVGPSSSLGARAMRATAAANGAPSFLEIEGKQVAGSWAGALGVSLRIETLPQSSVAGPEIGVRDANGEVIAHIAIVVTNAGLGLEQRGAGCGDSACAERLDMLMPIVAGEWSRVVLGVEAQDAATGPYGRIEISVDGSDNAMVPLAVRPIGGRIVALAGITRADTAPSALRVDDVMFFTR